MGTRSIQHFVMNSRSINVAIFHLSGKWRIRRQKKEDLPTPYPLSWPACVNGEGRKEKAKAFL